MSRLPISLLLSIATFSVPASAQRLLVLADGPVAETLAARMRPALARAHAGSLVFARDLEGELDRALEAAPATMGLAMATALESVTRRYAFAADPEQALALLEKTLADAQALLPRLIERDALWDAIRRALLSLAHAALLQGQAERARAFVLRVVRRDPDWQPPPRDFAPQLRALHTAIREEVGKGQVELRVAGREGVRVAVEGVFRGTAPLKVRVPLGPISLQAFAEGVLTAPRAYKIDTAGLDLRLEPFCAREAHRARARCRHLIRAAAHATSILELRAKQGAVRLRLWNGDLLARDVVAPLALRLERGWLAELADYGLGKRDKPPILTDAGPPFYRRWWFWSLVGAAAVGGTLGAILAPRGASGTDFTFSR